MRTRRCHAAIKRTLVSVFLMLVLGSCALPSESEFRAAMHEAARSKDGLPVEGQVNKVTYIPAAHLQWPTGTPESELMGVFVHVELSGGRCYLFQGHGFVEEGEVIQGVVMASLVADWPIEVLSIGSSCLPLDVSIRE